jgi:branched-chain amino acid transport system permease protein
MRFGSVKEGYRFIGAVITDIQVLIIAVSCLLMFGSWWLLQGTKLGKAIRAVSDDPVAANIVGINSDRIILYSFLTGSALAGIAGILISFETNIEPTMGFTAVLKGIVASIVGGVGNVPGAVLGGFFLGLVENLGIWHIRAEWKDAIAFGILIAFLLIRPLGFWGTRTEKEGL